MRTRESILTTLLTGLSLGALADPGSAQQLLGSWNGSQQSEQLGDVHAAFLDDLDGDGVGEFAIGSPRYVIGGQSLGRVVIRSGRTHQTIAILEGADPNGGFGRAVVNVGDLNGDGVGEFAVSAPNIATGRVTVYSGATLTALWHLFGTPGEYFGNDVAALGDANLDGLPDFAVSAPYADKQIGLLGLRVDCGRIDVRSGAGPLLHQSYGAVDHATLGFVMREVGDVDADGVTDLGAGMPNDGTAFPNAGKLQVRSGADGVAIWTRYGVVPGKPLGKAFASAGDLDGDGFGDVAAGTPDGGNGAGRVHLFLGVNAYAAAPILGGPAENFGAEVAAVGDVNGDGRADFAIGAPSAGGAGCVEVRSGANLATLATFVGPNPHGWFGDTIAAGDLDHDGAPELLIGASSSDVVQVNAGSVHLATLATCQPSLGFAGPGNLTLSLCGAPLASGNTATLRLAGGQPFAPALLLLSLQQAPTPAFGGTIVPSVGALHVVPLQTDLFGKVTFASVPGGFGPLNLYLQALAADPQQPKGAAISNAIVAQFLP